MSNAGYAITFTPHDSEMGRRGEELPVVRVDLGEAVLRRRRQMKRVGGAEIERGRGGGEGGFDPVEDGIGEREELKVACCRVRLDLKDGEAVVPVASRLLPDFSKRRGGILGASMGGGAKPVHRGGVGANLIRPVFGALELEQVVRVIVGLDHLASRSSEMIVVESVPPLNAPAFRASSNSGNSFRVAQ